MVIKDFAEMVVPLIPEDVRKEADGFFDWMYGKDVDAAKKKAKKEGFPEDMWELYYEAKSTCGLPKEHFVPLDSLKRLWRREHPAICKFWKDIDVAVRMAVEIPNRSFPFGNGCVARRSGKWVRLILPSGHNLCYPGMRIGKAKSAEDQDSKDSGNDLVFKGVQQFTNKWSDITTHGGKLSENLTQCLARDIFKRGQLLAERNMFDVILPLHDELVCDVPDTPDFPVRILEEIMSDVPEWVEGLPLSAKGFEDYRYHKDYD
jgi:DNA polymerase